MKLILVSLFIVCFSYSSYSQNDNINQIIEENFAKVNIPALSKSQMYADFDTLSHLLKNVYPYYHIKAELNSTNYDNELLKLRNQISDIRQADDFIWVLFKAITMFCDKHLEIPHPQGLNYYKRNEDKFTTQLTPENIVCTYKYYMLTHDSLYVKAKLGLRLKYIDGAYYTLRAFKYKNQIYPEGILLKSIDGVSINKFVNQHYTSISGVSYDYERRQYFSDFFFLSPDFIHKTSHLLVFENDKNETLADTFYVHTAVEGLSKKQNQEDNPAIFTVYDSILYVRLPIMDDASFYIQEIQKQFSPNMKKIVIDIRGNRGGMDKVWTEILSSIVTDTIKQQMLFYANNTREIKNYLLKNGFDSIQSEYVSLLKSNKIKVTEGESVIAPSDSSILFRGKIIVLQDENTFSAAGSLLTIAKNDDNIISAGYSMNDIGGRGLSPLLFQLPHTKMLIRMPFIIDYSSVDKWADFLRNIPEVECKQSISDFLKTYYSNNPYQLESLLKDKCFLKAISL